VFDQGPVEISRRVGHPGPTEHLCRLCETALVDWIKAGVTPNVIGLLAGACQNIVQRSKTSACVSLRKFDVKLCRDALTAMEVSRG
jgi:hypothetical protein